MGIAKAARVVSIVSSNKQQSQRSRLAKSKIDESFDLLADAVKRVKPYGLHPIQITTGTDGRILETVFGKWSYEVE